MFADRVHLRAVQEEPLVRRSASRRAASRPSGDQTMSPKTPGPGEEQARVPGTVDVDEPHLAARSAARERQREPVRARLERGVGRSRRRASRPCAARGPAASSTTIRCADGDREQPAVRRPRERGRAGRRSARRQTTRPASASRSTIAPPEKYATVCRRAGSQAGGDVAARAVEQLVAGAVAGDDAQAARARGRRCACRCACPPSAARRRRGAAASSARRSSTSSATSSFARRRDDVEPVRRPLRVRRTSRCARLRPLSCDEPDAAVARPRRRAAARCRQREERRLGVLDADRLAHLLEDGVARRRERSPRRRPRQPRRAPATSRLARAPRRGRALLVRAPHDLPGALLGVAHASSSFIRSRPRRRRELTVPRGRSSSSAISPGVYSST